MEIYEILITKNLQFGPLEDVDEILDNLSILNLRKMRNIHEKNSRGLSERHIITLMSNSSVGHDNFDEDEKFKFVMRAYKFLNSIRLISLILKIVAASKNFKIIFDFSRENVRHMDPTASKGTNGLAYLTGRIYVAAKQFLDPQTEKIVYGVMAHEFCHYAMQLTYENRAKPYASNDVERKREFNEVRMRTYVKRNHLKGHKWGFH